MEIKKAKPHHALTEDVMNNTVQFSRFHAKLQPAAPGGRPGVPPIYLPAVLDMPEISGFTNPYLLYILPVHLQAVCIRGVKPRTDFCPQCDRLREKVQWARNKEEITSNKTKKRSLVLTMLP